MTSQSRDFGRRHPPPSAPPPRSASIPPIGRKLFGLVIGVSAAIALTTMGRDSMRHAERWLEQHWESATKIPAPEAALARVPDAGMALRSIEQACRGRAKAVSLPAGLSSLGAKLNVYQAENDLARQAEFVRCLASERPQRLCQEPDRRHLNAAIADYFKLVALAKEDWSMATSSFGRAMFMVDGAERAMLPSARTDVHMAAAIAETVRQGYVPASALGSLFGLRMPGDLGDLLKGVRPLRRGCA